MIDRIALGGPVPAGFQFAYDADYRRIKQCVPGCNTPTAVTTYLNALGGMSEKFVSGGTTTWRDYVVADGRLVALRAKTGTTVTLRYFVLDHLGSVSVVSDETGAVTERLSYDAWGRHRHGNDWTDDPTCTSGSATTTRGFTGAEEMDAVCDVNLNARVYDPTIGRFLSPDSVTETVFDLQVLNRYSYVGNNPLSYTDPSGHCFLGCFWSSGIFRAVVAIVAAATLQAELSSAEPAASTTAELSPQLAVLNAGISGGVSGLMKRDKIDLDIFKLKDGGRDGAP